ncbi:MAG: TIGR04053 family radical SAM/SPASM domain-containing protein [bacterium]
MVKTNSINMTYNELLNKKILYNDYPLLIYWELTRACDLACKHCRANSIKFTEKEELSTQEVFAVIDDIKQNFSNKSVIVFTGGDPLKREDLWQIIEYTFSQGVRFALAPSVTPLLTPKVIEKLKKYNVESIALSLDSYLPEKHDYIRQVEKTFHRTVEMAKIINSYGINLQINTLIYKESINELENFYEFLSEKIKPYRWSLFLLIRTGRGYFLEEPSASEVEKFNNRLYKIHKNANFIIKTTELHHYRRTFIKKLINEGKKVSEIVNTSIYRGAGIRDGNGIIFISSYGKVYPSGFLPVVVGNLREKKLSDIYKNSEILKKIRDADNFKGKCGVCEFRYICGGSRSRAFSRYGDYLEEEPLCLYKPLSQ